jgi:hypothetical protein
LTFGDLLDNLERAADDSSDDYRAAARTWLNLVRAHVKKRARWRSSVTVGHFVTSSGVANGIYPLRHISKLAEDTLYDETNIQPVRHESHALLNSIDVNKTVTGPPSWWGDAGSDSAGERLIYLWPIPNGTFTIRYTGQGKLSNIEESEEDFKIDPFFGPVIDWSDVFEAGLMYHHRKDSNEDANQTFAALKIFDSLIDQSKGIDRVAPVSSIGLQNVRSRSRRRRTGRFDPAHFQNR